jgi:hypothetical protein
VFQQEQHFYSMAAGRPAGHYFNSAFLLFLLFVAA